MCSVHVFIESVSLSSNGTTLTDGDVDQAFFIGPNTTFHASLVTPTRSDACCFYSLLVCHIHVVIVCGMCVYRLAVLNQKLTSLERQVEYIEARVTKT